MLDQIKDHETSFRLEEATIADLHEAIRAGKTTLVEVVERYIDRARAYNGIAYLMLREDGASRGRRERCRPVHSSSTINCGAKHDR
jgi:amidase